MKKNLTIMLLLLSAICKGQTITTVAGTSTGGSSAEGAPATNANLGFVGYITFDDTGNYYFGSSYYKIRKISVSGEINTIAGTGFFGYNSDGIPATTAKLSLPGDIAIDKKGLIYICDINNNRIRRYNPTTGLISTFAGTGVPGFSGDGAAATSAMLSQPWSLQFDKTGNLFFADAANFRIRKIDTNGLISTIAGSGINGSDGDGGQATNAKLEGLESVRIDKHNNLYISQTTRIRKINLTTGIITHVAGTGVNGYSGNGGPASSAALYAVVDIAIDAYGNLFFTEEYNHIIRKIDNNGIISLVAGTALPGMSGDGGNCISAQLNHPRGLAFDTCGNLYVADAGNARIRKIALNPDCLPVAVPEVTGNTVTTPTIYPNPATETLTINAGVAIAHISISNAMGQQVLELHPTGGKKSVEANVQHLPLGMYIVRVNDVWVGKLVKE